MKITSIKSGIRETIRMLGYDVYRLGSKPSRDPFFDMHQLTQSRSSPVIFDVGANHGQTVDCFLHTFAKPKIHAFEPGSDAFYELQKKHSGLSGLYLNNFALGAKPGVFEFNETTNSTMSSFLEPSVDSWGETIKQRVQVDIRTIDDYCAEQNVNTIDILKSDTQGFDLEVLKGATRLFAQQRIHLIYLEIIFSEMYKGLPRFDEICRFLFDQGLLLVTFYEFHYQNGRVGWTDALFINPRFNHP